MLDCGHRDQLYMQVPSHIRSLTHTHVRWCVFVSCTYPVMSATRVLLYAIICMSRRRMVLGVVAVVVLQKDYFVVGVVLVNMRPM